MNRYTFLIVAVMAMFLVSCEKPEAEKTMLTAEIVDTQTKTYLNTLDGETSGKLYWESGDNFYITNGSTEAAAYLVNGADGGKSSDKTATFSVGISSTVLADGTWYACYPAKYVELFSSDKSVDSETHTFKMNLLPDGGVLTYKADSLFLGGYMPMVGTYDSTYKKIKFYPVMSALCLSLKGDNLAIASVSITDSSNNLYGVATITDASNPSSASLSFDSPGTGGKTLTYSLSGVSLISSDATNFVFPIAAGIHTLTVDVVKTNNDGTYTRTLDNKTFVKGTVHRVTSTVVDAPDKWAINTSK